MDFSSIDIPKFIEALKSFEGQPYCWPTKDNNYSGKGLSTALYKDCHDCSGCVTDALFRSTSGKIDLRSTANAQRLFELTSRVSAPREGDLVFYGSGPSKISHVMSIIGDRPFGASGGDHTTVTPDIARQMNASVRYQKSVNYRKDFVGYGRF